MYLKQSTATTVIIGPVIDDTDGKTPETALTVTSIDVDIYKGTTKTDLTITASGGSNDMAHVANGYYSLELTTGNTDTVGRFRVTANISGALPVWRDCVVLPGQVYDSLIGGTDALQVHANEITNNLITAAAIADNAIDAGALAADAANEIRDAIWNLSPLGREDPNTMSGVLILASGDPSASAIADAVWDEALSGHVVAGSAGEALGDVGGGSSPAAIADAVWDAVMLEHVLPGTTGESLIHADRGNKIGDSTTAAANLKKAFTGDTYNAAGLTVAAASAVASTVNARLVSMYGDSFAFDKFLNLLKSLVSGLVTAGTNTTTVVTSAGLSAVNGFYVGKTFVAISGANAGQGGKLVVGYDGATKRLTIEALTAPMAVGDTFILVG